MKILHVIYTQGVGGAEKYLKQLLPGLKGYGIICDLVVVCSGKTAVTFSSYCNDMNALGINTHLIVAEKYSIIQTAAKVNRYLRVHKINILHSHLFHADLMAAVVKMIFNRRAFVISTKHGYQEKVLQQYDPVNYKQPHDLYYYITKYIIGKIDINIAVSKAMSDLYFNLRISKIHYPYIHHGMTVEAFDETTVVAGSEKKHPQLITIGRLELIKGHHCLIDAMPWVLEVFPQAELLVFGEGTEKQNLLTQVKNAGLENNIKFAGFAPEPFSYIRSSDIIIQPSFFESFGLVFIEAFALKTPVVAFDVPAGNEIMENEKTAMLVKKGDSKALAQKIIYLLQNPAVCNRLTENAFETYRDNFTTEAMVRKTAAWYKSLL